MKTRILYLLAMSFFMLDLTNTTLAQAPLSIPYQAVARDAAGAIVPNRSISLRFRLRDVSAAGSILYEETQNVTTNVLGSFTANLGLGMVVSGSMASINWGTNAKYLQVEMDINGGSSFTDMGARQLFSVPYALYSNAGGGWSLSGTSIQTSSSTYKVGVGVSSPLYKLDVGDRMRIRTSTLGNLSSTPGIWLDDYRNGNTNVFLGMQDSIRLGIWGSTGLGFGFNFNTKSGNTNIGNYLGDTYRLALSGSSNGLGLYNSANNFYGDLTANAKGDLVVASAYGSTFYSPITGFNTYPANNILLNPPSAAGILTPFFPGNVGINVDSPTARLHVNGDLMVGSGRPAAGYKLSVNGKIIAEEVKVQLNSYWPDYVFDKKYQLLSIPNLQSYIETNKHLPNIPEAKDIEKNGLKLGDMQTRMMEKIEELTLYIIELQKQIDELKKTK